MGPPAEPDELRRAIAPYTQASVPRGAGDVLTSVVPYVGLLAAMYVLAGISVWLPIALAVPAAGFLVRTFIVFHDCSHNSFLPSRRANALVGAFCGMLVYSPFHSWRHEHAVHHATAGDLDKRGMGDVGTWTVAEYRQATPGARRAYRLVRNPVVMLGLGPIWALMIKPRLVPRWARARFGSRILATDAIIVAAIAGLVVAFGWKDVLIVQLSTAMLAGATGIWLFYVQHQFEDVYWERHEDWDYATAALHGSSYLRLPKVLQFFTGNIGLHHVHHLNAKIPNYNLQRAHDSHPVFATAPRLSLGDGIRALRLKLYDEDARRMVGFAAARRANRAAAPTAPAA
ncbi:MAG TPA: fatty acid desaturase [Solirubrobacteraceae bacterium]|nr:fatty acid desaturase [Solirubrobacteraceae bacterium]